MGSVILPNALAPPKLLLLNLEVPSKEVNFYQLHFRNGSSFKHFVSSQVFIQIGNCNIEIFVIQFQFHIQKGQNQNFELEFEICEKNKKQNYSSSKIDKTGWIVCLTLYISVAFCL
jgi:hypothetical protein